MEHRYRQLGFATVAAAWAVFWLVGTAASDRADYQDVYVQWAITVAILGGPSVIAAGLLWPAWWPRAAARLPAGLARLDGPARLLAVTAAALPAGRRDWGTAMTAELAQVRDRSARWWFAAGCARAALVMARHRRPRRTTPGSGCVTSTGAWWTTRSLARP